MKLSRETEYGLRGLLALARRPPDEATMLAEIARGERLPYSFLSKIFQKLAQHRIVIAHRGAQRGYTLARRPAAISVLEILEAIEGPDMADRCLLWDRDCSPLHACLLHQQTSAARRSLAHSLARTTLAGLGAAPRRTGGVRRAGSRPRDRRP